jgi:hypothetical protein
MKLHLPVYTGALDISAASVLRVAKQQTLVMAKYLVCSLFLDISSFFR